MVRWSSLVAVALAAVGVFFAGSAQADVLSACNGAAIFQGSGTLNCTLETSGGCEAQCEPVNFQVACTGQLEASCMGQCTAMATASCNATCQGNCTGQCTAPNFSCEGYCQGDCEGSCSGTCMGQCASSSNMATCMGDCTAQCKASCGARCTGSCQGNPGGCTAECNASCSGDCTAQANVNCDVSCQAMGYANCTSMLTGGCQAQCQTPKGALFCNGQFVNVDTSQLDNCINAIEAEFNIQVSGSASAGCEGGTCSAEAQGKASASCDMSPSAPPISGALLALGLGGIAAGVVRRRIRRTSRI